MTYLIFDAEYRVDHEGHALYQAAERHDPDNAIHLRDNDPCVTPRWVFRRPVCISWLVLKQEERGLSVGRIETAGMPEMDEAEMLGHFFEAVRWLPRNTALVSWGGCTSDVPQLRLAAMRHDIALPEQLAMPFNARIRRPDDHIDLMTHMCGDATRQHMAETCASLRIPAKVTAAPGAVAAFIASGKWSMVKAICENDVLSTAALLAHVLCNRNDASSLFGALRALAMLGSEQVHRPYAEAFTSWASDLLREETARCQARLPVFA